MSPRGTCRLRGGHHFRPHHPISGLGGFSRLSLDPNVVKAARLFPGEGGFSPPGFTDPDALTVGPGSTWHMTAQLLLFREGQMIFPTNSSPAPIPLSSLPPSIPDVVGLFPATSLAENLHALHPAGPRDAQNYFFSIKKLLCSSPGTSTCCPHGPQLFATSSGLHVSRQRHSTRGQHEALCTQHPPVLPGCSRDERGDSPPKGLGWGAGGEEDGGDQ